MILKEYHTLNGIEMVTTTVAPQFTPEPTIAGPDETAPSTGPTDEAASKDEEAALCP